MLCEAVPLHLPKSANESGLASFSVFNSTVSQNLVGNFLPPVAFGLHMVSDVSRKCKMHLNRTSQYDYGIWKHLFFHSLTSWFLSFTLKITWQQMSDLFSTCRVWSRIGTLMMAVNTHSRWSCSSASAAGQDYCLLHRRLKPDCDGSPAARERSSRCTSRCSRAQRHPGSHHWGQQRRVRDVLCCHILNKGISPAQTRLKVQSADCNPVSCCLLCYCSLRSRLFTEASNTDSPTLTVYDPRLNHQSCRIPPDHGKPAALFVKCWHFSTT